MLMLEAMPPQNMNTSPRFTVTHAIAFSHAATINTTPQTCGHIDTDTNGREDPAPKAHPSSSELARYPGHALFFVLGAQFGVVKDLCRQDLRFKARVWRICWGRVRGKCKCQLGVATYAVLVSGPSVAWILSK